MLDVCSTGPAYRGRAQLTHPGATLPCSGGGRCDSPASMSSLQTWSFEYQNPVRNPYGLLPRPPQTQAAHFKRLYQK